MKILSNKFTAWTAIAVLGAASLFAAATTAADGHRHGRQAAFLSSYLNLSPAQQDQAKSIFEAARQSAMPIRQQLRQTRQSLRSAVQANDAAQIQQLAVTQGNEMGQLTAIRSTAFAKVYQMLTPEQQGKLAELQQARKAGRQAPAGAQN